VCSTCGVLEGSVDGGGVIAAGHGGDDETEHFAFAHAETERDVFGSFFGGGVRS